MWYSIYLVLFITTKRTFNSLFRSCWHFIILTCPLTSFLMKSIPPLTLTHLWLRVTSRATASGIILVAEEDSFVWIGLSTGRTKCRVDGLFFWRFIANICFASSLLSNFTIIPAGASEFCLFFKVLQIPIVVLVMPVPRAFLTDWTVLITSSPWTGTPWISVLFLVEYCSASSILYFHSAIFSLIIIYSILSALITSTSKYSLIVSPCSFSPLIFSWSFSY